MSEIVRMWDLQFPPEPPADVQRVRDADGDVWHRVADHAGGGMWALRVDGGARSSWRDLMEYAPLTEVVDD